MPSSRQPGRNAPAWKLDFPQSLPITARRDEIVRAIRDNPVVVLSGETGSGKTTQIPKFCLEAGRGVRGMIACTQPRRVAALSVSRRVAEELGVHWGREVGCKIRFNDHTSPRTAIKFLTDGMLLAEVHGDPMLRAYDTIVVDEAHERSLNIDFLLGHLNGLRKRRPDLRIVITSATIDTAKFSAAFGDAPIIEVSGRTFPVEIIYAPPDEMLEQHDDATRVDAAVDSLLRIVDTRQQGDVLIFMPTERDIRDTADLIEGRKLRGVTVLPLFGRLSADEQQRIFAPTPGRKVVVATNIAETSLTIPGIRFVIDGGEARISRYNPRTRTKRLPIEPVSQSSANQRSGRAGRVEAGVCIRLYSEEDFAKRPVYTAPEILRANLAEVILRMSAARLGEIETFPFIDPPPAAAIKAGHALLEEIGAIDAPGALTDIGHRLAALPIDPTVGRMLLEARRERALDEVLVIASALGIQDPRERPLGKEAAADAAHAKFVNPDSDFLTLLKIWEAVHDETERLPLGKLKKFCKGHFLSFIRMREWHDVHSQLTTALGARQSARARAEQESEAEEDDDVLTVGTTAGESNDAAASAAHARSADWLFGGERYRAVHRSILTGLLSNIAVRDEGNVFKATSERRVVVFPGSALFVKPGKKREEPARQSKRRGPRDFWITCAEVLETQRLYARTAAKIDPLWIEEIGAHVCRHTYAEPDWSADSGRVLVRETVRLHGLEIRNRMIDFGRVDPAAATEIFIRAALVGDTLESPLKFLAHNRRVRARVATILTRQRSNAWLDLDGAAFRFYAARIEGVSSVHDLNRLWKERVTREPKFLFMDESDLLSDAEGIDNTAFPEEVALDNRVVPLDYVYKPGDVRDGVTLRLPYSDREKLTPGFLDWVVPGNIHETVEVLLRGLPKEARQRLAPIAERVGEIAAKLKPGPDSPGLADSVAGILARDHDLDVSPSQLAAIPLPDHLKVRVEIVDNSGNVIAAGRELAPLRDAIRKHERALAEKPATSVEDAWRKLAASVERDRLTDWTIGSLPPRIKVCEHAGVPVWAYPAVVDEGKHGVALRLFRTDVDAAAAMSGGVAALVEAQLSRELAWLERDLKDLRELGPAAVALQPMERWRDDAFACIRASLREQPVGATTREAFALRVAACREHLKGIVWRLIDMLRESLAARQDLLAHSNPYAGLDVDVAAIVHPGFLRETSWNQLPHLPRYLKAMKVRADRWKQDPGKDHRRAMQVAPWVKAAHEARGKPGAEEFRWLVEEYRVSVFAQELGTARPVSEKKLEAARAAIGKASTGMAPTPAESPAPKPGVPKLKSVKLNRLSDLGRALGR